MCDILFPWLWFLLDSSSSFDLRLESAFMLYSFCSGVGLFLIFLWRCLSLVKGKKLSVVLPPAVYKQVVALADRLGSSESKAATFLIMKGCEALQASENPFREKPGTS
jgi:hypothetical protein